MIIAGSRSSRSTQTHGGVPPTPCHSGGAGTAARYATPRTTARSTGRSSRRGIQPSGVTRVSKYRSRASFMPLRTSATTFPGAHAFVAACVAGGVAARNCSEVRRAGSGLTALHRVASRRADRATESAAALASAASVVLHSMASAACAAASATAASASSTDMSAFGGTRRSKSSTPRRPVNQASRRSSHSCAVAPDARSIASRGGSTRDTTTARRSPAASPGAGASAPVPSASGSAAHRFRHARSHCVLCAQNLVEPLSTNRITAHSAVAASSRAWARARASGTRTIAGSPAGSPAASSAAYPSRRKPKTSNASRGFASSPFAS